MSEPQPLGPFKLVTVNTAPERAKKIISRVVEAVKDKYTTLHTANVEGEQLNLQWCIRMRVVNTGAPLIAIKDVAATVGEIQPDFLVCAAFPPVPQRPISGLISAR
jgi:hypothetical protein